MGGQAEHYKIGIRPAQNMLSVRVVVGLRSLLPDEVHYLVFALARDVRIRQNNLGLVWNGLKLLKIKRITIQMHLKKAGKQECYEA